MKLFRCLFVLLLPLLVAAQRGFEMKPGKHSCSIRFQLINNLIFVKAKLNGVPVTLLVDSGVEETILFNLDEGAQIGFQQAESVSLRGLGEKESMQGLKSKNNTLEIGKLTDRNHLLYILLERDFNLSSHIGIPVHGIVGQRFFANHLIQIDYQNSKLKVYDRDWALGKRKFSDYASIPMLIDRNKPYLDARVSLKEATFDAKLLIDTGNSDAIWLFTGMHQQVNIPQPNIPDYLGYGFSGEIHGSRARIPRVSIGNFIFDDAITAFPEEASIRNLPMVERRLGSVGGEILKRFDVVFDYIGQQLLLRPNNAVAVNFEYNMSGISLEHSGFHWIQQRVTKKGNEENQTYYSESRFSLTYELKPRFSIVSVRPDSPGDEAQLQKDDVLISINGKEAHRYNLDELMQLLKSGEGRVLKLKVERDGKIINSKITLRKLI